MSTINSTAKNPKEMWKKLNKLTNKKSKTTSITKIVVEDKVSEGPETILNTFNKFFNEIGVHLAKGNSVFEIQNVSETEVFRLLSTITTSKATGHDRILPKVLKH